LKLERKRPSIATLAYLGGDKSGIPDNKLIIIPTVIIGKDDVDKYAANLKAMAGN